jgi:hypothetical protein
MSHVNKIEKIKGCLGMLEKLVHANPIFPFQSFLPT